MINCPTLIYTYLLRLLKEKISLLSPTSSPQKKRLSTSPRLHRRVTPLVGMNAVVMSSRSNGRGHSSPLLKKAASPLVSGGKTALADAENSDCRKNISNVV